MKQTTLAMVLALGVLASPMATQAVSHDFLNATRHSVPRATSLSGTRSALNWKLTLSSNRSKGLLSLPITALRWITIKALRISRLSTTRTRRKPRKAKKKSKK